MRFDFLVEPSHWMAGRLAQQNCELRIANCGIAELRNCAIAELPAKMLQSRNLAIPQSRNSKFDTLLGANSRGKWVLYLGHFRYQVRGFDELRRGVPAGNYNV